MTPYSAVLRALLLADVRFVVVGGMAVVLQGHARLTVDLDVVVDLDEAPARRAVEALVSCGLRPRLPVDPTDFAVTEVRRDWIDNRNLQVFSFFDPADPLREVDVFVESPVDFEQLCTRADHVQVDGLSVPVASIEDLVAMKRRAGRPHDLSDVEALERIAEERR